MELIYKNEKGTLKLNGSGGSGFTICEIEGLDLLEKTRTVTGYVGEDGVMEENSRYVSRIISISGDLRCGEDSYKVIHDAARILSSKGTLYINNKNKQRVITVNASTLTFGQNHGIYKSFVLQFVCDYPHFKDEKDTVCYVFKKEHHLTKNTVFPVMLTQRISEGSIYNNGDLKVYPVITIKKNSGTGTQNTITVSNLTTEKTMILEKEMQIGEIIEINVRERTIKSNIDGNIMGTLEQYSLLSDMWIDYGENIICVNLDGVQKGLEVSVIYNNEYLEAL